MHELLSSRLSEPAGVHFTAALRRAVLEELEQASQLLTEQAQPADARVHGARKHLKRLRALADLDPGLLRPTERLAIATVARSLGRVRDPVAQLQTWSTLEPSMPPEAAALARAVLEEQQARVSSTRDLQRRVRRSALVLSGVGQVLSTRWAAPVSAGGPDVELAIERLRRTYRQGRRALRRAANAPDAERLHELRRFSKKHGFQLGFVKQLLGPRVRAHRSELSRLGEDLGEHHDLAAIAALLLDRETLRGPVRKRLERRLRRLEVRALSRAARIYVKRPKAFERRLRRYFELQAR